jgi:hypothetical protein
MCPTKTCAAADTTFPQTNAVVSSPTYSVVCGDGGALRLAHSITHTRAQLSTQHHFRLALSTSACYKPGLLGRSLRPVLAV